MEAREEKYMEEALLLARLAARRGEVPVGCVIVQRNRIIGRGYNLRECRQDTAGHAEMAALSDAAAATGFWRLPDAELFVTLEPCPMCAGAMIQSRVKRLVYGAPDPKAGAAGSVVNLFEPGMFNHDVDVLGGMLGRQCSDLIREFFAELRKRDAADPRSKHTTVQGCADAKRRCI